MFRIVKNLARYEIVCKRRNHHEPNQADLEDFIKNPSFRKETFCKDCGSSLELELDDGNSQHYWIREI